MSKSSNSVQGKAGIICLNVAVRHGKNGKVQKLAQNVSVSLENEAKGLKLTEEFIKALKSLSAEEV